MRFCFLLVTILPNLLKSVIGGAYTSYNLIQESPRQDGIYEYYYKFDKNISKRNKERFLWVIRYIMRGSNILFIEPRNPNTEASVISESARCFAIPDSVVISDECTMRDIVSQVLASLGVFYEVKRYDDMQRIPIGKSVVFIESHSRNSYTSLTHFDSASVTNYKKLFYVPPYSNYAEYYEKSVYSRVLPDTDYFELSSCDWYTLNKMYPGPKHATECIPGNLPEGLIPSETFIAKVGKEKALSDCRIRYNTLYESGSCLFKNKEDFPSSKRIRFSKYLPGATLTKDQINSYCCAFTNFTGGIIKPNEYDCYKSCREICPKEFGNFPIGFCMKYRFLGCIKNVLKNKK